MRHYKKFTLKNIPDPIARKRVMEAIYPTTNGIHRITKLPGLYGISGSSVPGDTSGQTYRQQSAAWTMNMMNSGFGSQGGNRTAVNRYISSQGTRPDMFGNGYQANYTDNPYRAYETRYGNRNPQVTINIQGSPMDELSAEFYRIFKKLLETALIEYIRKAGW